MDWSAFESIVVFQSKNQVDLSSLGLGSKIIATYKNVIYIFTQTQCVDCWSNAWLVHKPQPITQPYDISAIVQQTLRLNSSPSDIEKCAERH